MIIDRAEYVSVKSLLQVGASSNGTGAVLTAYVTSTNAFIGRLTSIGGGRFRGKFTLSVNPQNITVRSGYGGSASRAVVVK